MTVVECEALAQIEGYLLLNGKSLRDFLYMPVPPPRTLNTDVNGEDLDQLICKERSYDIMQLQDEFRLNVPLLNNDQCAIYDAIM
jgi:hypothetical protein